MLYERRHTRLIEDFGGIAKVMPVFSAFFMIATLSSIGLPLTNGFVGEFLTLIGVFAHTAVYGIIAASGVIFAACYMLWMYQRVIFGKVTNPANEKLEDINWRERIILIPLVIFIFWIGIYPKPFLDRIEPAVKDVLVRVSKASTVELNDKFQLQETLGVADDVVEVELSSTEIADHE